MIVIYRFSDKGYPKNKPDYVTKRGCILHALRVFTGHPFYVIADNTSDDSYAFLMEHVPDSTNKVIRTTLSNAGAYMYAVKFAIDTFRDDDVVYLAEDDYVYTPDAPGILAEGIAISDYVSGYDHPDKYVNHNEGGPNPFIQDGGEVTRVLLTANHHWKHTNSCCMTFACKVKTLKADWDVYMKYCSGTHPHDFPMFCELVQQRGRRLISAIPGVSTHGETQWLSPLVDWAEIMNR